MKIKNRKLINRFKKFINNIKKNDRIAIIHDNDPDGICSAVILTKLIEKVKKKEINLRLDKNEEKHIITNYHMSQVKKYKINKIITTDLSIDERPDSLKKLEATAEILAIDHHKLYNNLNSEKTVLLKPQLLFKGIDAAQYPASKLAYDLSLGLADISDSDWIAAIGVIGDCGFNQWRDFLISVFKKHKLKLKANWFDTILGRISGMLSSAGSYSQKNIALCYKTLHNATCPKELFDSKIARFQNLIESEIGYYIKNMKMLAEFYNKDIIFYEIKPKYNIKSPLSTILGNKYKNKTIIIADVKKNKVPVSARRSDYKIKVNELLENAVKGLKEAGAGGHNPAAGAVVRKKDYAIFKKRVLEGLKS